VIRFIFLLDIVLFVLENLIFETFDHDRKPNIVFYGYLKGIENLILFFMDTWKGSKT